MKQSFNFIMAAIIILASACSKSNPDYQLVHESSSIIPYLSITKGTAMNLIEMEVGQFYETFTFNCNVPYITGGYDDSQNGFGFSAVPSGSNSVKISRGEAEYTRDIQNTLVEDPFTGKWINYCNDGPLEIIFTTRVRGTNGTKYIDFTNIATTAADENAIKKYTTYAKGEVTAISDITSGTEQTSVYASRCWHGFFPDLGAANCKVNYVTITISDGANAINVKVMGKQREGEIGRLMQYISVGDMVEVPATVRKSKEVLDTVVASSVLRLEL